MTNDRTGLRGLLDAAAAGVTAPAPADLLDGVRALERRQRATRARIAVCATILVILAAVGGTGWVLDGHHGAATRPAAVSASRPPTTPTTETSTAPVPAQGQLIPGPRGRPDAVSGGRLVAATGVLSNTGFGLVAPLPYLSPKRTAAQAYALAYGSGGPGSSSSLTGSTRPVVTLAMATQSYYKPSHNALVWVFVWAGQRCGFSGGPAVPGQTPQTADPSGTPCTAWAIMSDTTGKVMLSGDAATTG